MSWKKVLLEGDAAVLSDTVPNTIQPDDAASAGVATEASRQDHEHAIVAAQPSGAVSEGASAAEGTGTSFVREDHVHACPATWTPTAHAADHKDGGGDDLDLDELGAPTGNVDFNQKQATSLALDVQASAPATPVDGQVYFNGTDDHPYVYVA